MLLEELPEEPLPDSEELAELARTILGAEEKLCALEYELYVEIRENLAAQMERIQRTAQVGS